MEVGLKMIEALEATASYVACGAENSKTHLLVLGGKLPGRRMALAMYLNFLQNKGTIAALSAMTIAGILASLFWRRFIRHPSNARCPQSLETP